MSGVRPLIRMREEVDHWDYRVRDGALISRSGREIEDVAAAPLEYRRGASTFQPEPREPRWSAPRYRDADAWRQSFDATDRAPVGTAHLQRCVVLLTGVSREDICGPSREPEPCKARFILSWALLTYANRSQSSIGALLGGRGHEAAAYGVARTNEAIKALGLSATDNLIVLIEALWRGAWPDARSARRRA